MVRNGVCVCICLPPFNFSSHPLLSLSSPPMRSHNSNRGTALMQCEASSIFFFLLFLPCNHLRPSSPSNDMA